MKFLVTGGTGFIGSHLIDRLRVAGYNVLVPVRGGSNIKWLPSHGINTIEANLLNPADVKKLLKDIEIVFHLASVRGSGWAYTDEQIWNINVRMTENLLRASDDKLRHFIYISSVSVYGHFNGGPANEDYPYAPVNRYGRTKYEAERLVKKYQKEKGLKTTIIQPVITYGPRDTWGMVPKLISLINSKRYLTVGSGENRVHLIYIDDLIDGLVLTINREGDSKETFILAGEEPITINSLVKIIEKTLNRAVPEIHVPLSFAKVTARLMEITHSALLKNKEPFITRDKINIMTIDRAYNIEKAKKFLGFSPKVNYEEGISRTIHWLKESDLIH
jgi:nucleoside-diphosphate-sugar epimerase